MCRYSLGQTTDASVNVAGGLGSSENCTGGGGLTKSGGGILTLTGTNLKMTFDMQPAAARGTSQLFLEYSSNLGTWSTGVLVPDATGGTAPVTFIVAGTNPLDVEATVSSSEAAAGKLFGHLRFA